MYTGGHRTDRTASCRVRCARAAEKRLAPPAERIDDRRTTADCDAPHGVSESYPWVCVRTHVRSLVMHSSSMHAPCERSESRRIDAPVRRVLYDGRTAKRTLPDGVRLLL